MHDSQGSIEILLLGTVSVRDVVRNEALRGRRQRITLARLALAEGRPVPVSALIDDLWPDKRPRDSGHALQAHMHRLRQQLRLDIEFINDGYRLTGDEILVDARSFTTLSERGRTLLGAGEPQQAATELERALSLWRGPALADIGDVVGLRSSALHLDEMRRAADADRVEALLLCGRGESVISELRASLAVDPLRETSWHQLIRALWTAGQESAALTAYGHAREAFVEALGAEPGSRLQELHQKMLAGAPPQEQVGRAATASSAAADSGIEASGVIGRSRELALMERAWMRSRHGVQVVTLSGEPGIGKSHLADHFVRQATAGGATAMRGRCDPWTGVAYQPFAEMLHHRIASSNGLEGEDVELTKRTPELTTILPSLSTAAPDPSRHRETDPHAAMDALSAWFAALSERQPLLLFIEDVHWADEQTLLTIRHILHSPRSVQALIVLCMRDTESDIPETSPLADLVRQSEHVTHIPLARFAEADVAELVSAESARFTATDAVPQWFDDYVTSASGGNPLFIVELTRHLLITEAAGVHDIPSLPAGINSVIWNRVDALPDGAKSLLQNAAVIGASFSHEFLARVSSVSSADVEALLQPALDRELIKTSARDPMLSHFTHDVVRTALYDSIPAVDRAGIHSRVASIIDAEGRGDQLKRHKRLAHHWLRSDLPGGDALSAEHLSAAGHESYARGALTDAEHLLAEALELMRPEAADSLRCDALTSLGMAQLRLARPGYRDSLLEASRLAVLLDDGSRLTRAVLANTRGWWSGTAGLDHERVGHIETALARCAEADICSRAQLLAAWSVENVRDLFARDDVLRAADEALGLAEQCTDDSCLPQVLSHRYAVLYALFEDPSECMRINKRLLSISVRSGDSRMRLSAALGLAQSSMRFGEFAIADRYLTEAARLSEALDDPARLWLVQGWQAMRSLIQGKPELAEQLILDNYSLGAKTGQSAAFTWFAGQLFTLRMVQGRLSEIVDQVRDQVASVADGIPSWRAALALTLARTGHPVEAGRILDDFAEESFSNVPRDMLWLHGMHYLSMTCEELGRSDLAACLYRLLLPCSGMIATNGTIGAGPVDLHLGVLALLQNQRSVAQQHLVAAAAMCRRIDAPIWLDTISARLAPLSKTA